MATFSGEWFQHEAAALPILIFGWLRSKDEAPPVFRDNDSELPDRAAKPGPNRGGHIRRSLGWRFAHLGHRFRPFYKGLEDFSSVCIQSGVAENPFLPSNVT